ncbi:MAG: hypothetical protein ACYSSK_11100, partial [Planctomycetota bacterium]
MKKIVIISIVTFLSLSSLPIMAVPLAYTITDLGTLGGNRSFAYGINDSGHVVGESYTGSAMHAFYYDGSMHDLGTMGQNHSGAYSINTAGNIAGSVRYSSESEAAVWQNGSGSILPGEKSAEAVSINETGQMAGFAGRPGVDGIYACYWDNGAKVDLSSLFSSTSRATGINNHEQVVGFSYSNQNGFLWDPDNGVTYLGAGRQPWAINDSGQVVLSGQGTVYLYQGGSMNNLGFNAYPRSINNHGQIVGIFEDAYNGTAFLWETGTVYQLSNLLAPGQEEWDFSYSGAYDINENGQIVGFAR